MVKNYIIAIFVSSSNKKEDTNNVYIKSFGTDIHIYTGKS